MTPLTEIVIAYNKWQLLEKETKLERSVLRQKIVNARDERYTLQRIADLLNVTPQAIHQMIKKGKK